MITSASGNSYVIDDPSAHFNLGKGGQINEKSWKN